MEGCCSRFTAAEGGARLAAAAGARNTLTTEYAAFISTRLVHEEAYKIRGLLSEGSQRSVYVTRASRVDCVAYELNILTDLAIAKSVEYEDVCDWTVELEKKEVLVCTSSVLKQILEEETLSMAKINVLILDSCHLISKDETLQYIMKLYKKSEENTRPRILALTYPIFSSSKKDINNLEECKDNMDNDDSSQESVEEQMRVVTPQTTNNKADTDEENIVCDKQIESEKVVDIGVYENLDDFEMYEKLEWKIDELEKELCCQMDLAEDIDGGKRISSTTSKPKELIIEYSSSRPSTDICEDYIELEKTMKDNINYTMDFLNEHRHDPSEIYGDELYDEFKNIPDPTIEPKRLLSQFLYILEQLGPYAADKAAFSLLIKLEKLKIKVPYERHFLLLCVCTTVFVRLRCCADLTFSKYHLDWDKIRLFSTPKVLRLAEILEKFRPPGGGCTKNDEKPTRNECDVIMDTEKMLGDIEKCDFTALGDRIEDKVNSIQANLKDINYLYSNINNTQDDDGNEVLDSEENNAAVHNGADMVPSSTDMVKDSTSAVQSSTDTVQNKDKKADLHQKSIFGFSRRTGHRIRSRGRVPRNNTARIQQMQQNPDALCGIVFMKEPLMAKIMFMVIADMSRHHPALSYICVQYCAAEQPADPRDCQRQGKVHEEVLKKFRMHECNLLLTTSALEEGIDLPRCNLVLRWDVPSSYRSYGLCRARARAPRAAAALLAATATAATATAASTTTAPAVTATASTTTAPAATAALLDNVATYRELDQIISRKCGCGVQEEPPPAEEEHADNFTHIIKPYSPHGNTADELTRGTTENTKNTEQNGGIQTNAGLGKATGNLNMTESESVVTKPGENRSESDENDKDEVKCDYINLYCNRCSKMKDSQNMECPCVLNVDSFRNGCENNESGFDSKKTGDSVASVDLSTAIALINRYCGKLPSDTFTRLAPQWWMERVRLPARGTGEMRTAYVCTLRLPLNCPIKYNIVGHPMPTRVLARRMVALQACRILHMSGELDNHLMPIGKENFKAAELESGGEYDTSGNTADSGESARPGTTKRRQYYYKRTAWAFTDCQPIVDTSDAELETTSGTDENKTEPVKQKQTGAKQNMLYAIVSRLWCALPERYNTRGRRLHLPQHAPQDIAILMARAEPDSLQIPAFPVYTRSGEVRVCVEHAPRADTRLSPRRAALVRRFMRFVFAEVLRVRRRGMALRAPANTNNYYIVPTIKKLSSDGTTKIDIDWPFLELIYQHTEEKKVAEIEHPLLWPNDEEEADGSSADVEENRDRQEVRLMENPLLKPGETFHFEADKYREAVVTPWYRNQDQPQFFLVAEICWNLTPDSAFPSATHTSFRNYYDSKYNVVLTQPNQPLLDVDHTSARLNLLTPRYVNRKGVALPVSSERTRRAKRDRLDQKQILVPELCRVHPFAAPLWFATVALPCVLYRINALLIADEIRRAVAVEVGLGVPKIDDTTVPGFQWPPLDFGWSLAEVLSADSEKIDKKREEEDGKREQRDKEIEDEEDVDQQNDEEESQEVEEDTKEKTINDILQEKEDAESGFEIGTWSNDMASSITTEYDEYMEPLPSNLTFCTSASGGANWCDPIDKPKSQFNPSRTFSMADSDCSYMSSDFDTDDSDSDSEVSDDDTDTGGFCSSKNTNVAMGVRIEYKTAHEAEAVDLERKKKVNPAPQPDEEDNYLDRMEYDAFIRAGSAPTEYIEKFRKSVGEHKQNIINRGNLIKHMEPITDVLPESNKETHEKHAKVDVESNTSGSKLEELFPYCAGEIQIRNGQIPIESIEKNKRILLAELKRSLPDDEVKKLNCFSMVDVDIDSPNYVNEKVANVGFDTKDKYVEKILQFDSANNYAPYYCDAKGQNGKEFDFDYQPELEGHPGPSPSVILQALTMSNANDGINLERLETIGDSFLKFAITAYLYCAHPTVHEGKLSHMRSKQVSNLNLYRLGRNKRLGARMIASKFEPHDNWLPPCHKPPPTLHPRLAAETEEHGEYNPKLPPEGAGCYIPYNLITQHSIPDKSIADCVEALIGAYLLECGPRGALLFMSWLGIRVLPIHRIELPENHPRVVAAQAKKPPPPPPPSRQRTSSESSSECSADEHSEPPLEETWTGPVGSRSPYRDEHGKWIQAVYGELKAPPSPLLRYIEDPEGELEQMLSGYDALERTLQYRFKDRSLLLQALTHASHQRNRLTDCYQRLEFLGDAILDYLITRHLYEDPRRHSPGALTDLRSALVNNTIFATLAARHGFHKYFRHMSPGLNEVLTKYVKIQEENGHSISEEHYLIQEDEMEQAEDVEVPKALGDLFESVAGAIFLDSGMSLGAVWKSYVNLMGAELEAFSAAAPKSPVRELLEAEPDTAKFGKPERLADGRRVRVCVEVFGRGAFKGIGRNYRIAKGTAARCALRHLRVHRAR